MNKSPKDKRNGEVIGGYKENSHFMDSYFKSIEYLFSSIPKQKTSKGKDDDSELIVESKFVVLGLDITSWSMSSQYIFCTTGVMVFLILYGLLQELVVMKTFNRSLGWFVTLLQLSGYAICAWLQSVTLGVRLERRIPYRQYTILAALQVLMQGFTNLSMHYLNYPAKMLFKSSRVLVTMLVGAVFRRQSYPRKDYMVGILMAVGLTLFVMADANSSPVFDVHGVFIISIALIADGAILNLQEHCLKTYNASHDELVYFSYMGAACFVFVINVLSGDLWLGCSYLHEHGSIKIFILFMAFACAGFLGVSCVAALTKRFGAITSAITSTVRKGLTLLLSYVFYPDDKTITIFHIFGGGIFMWGLFVRSLNKGKREMKGKKLLNQYDIINKSDADNDDDDIDEEEEEDDEEDEGEGDDQYSNSLGMQGEQKTIQRAPSYGRASRSVQTV